MTIERFQRIVLRLSNQMFVRHYLWMNYPHDPQVMGIQFMSNGATTGKGARKSSCDCGACHKCKHRQYVRNTRPHGLLGKELESLGFKLNEDLAIWTIERTDTVIPAADPAQPR